MDLTFYANADALQMLWNTEILLTQITEANTESSILYATKCF